MLQNSESVTPRINPPLSPAEREQRYRRLLRELRDPKFYQIRITAKMVRGLLKRGYLGPDTILGAHITVASSVARIVGSQRFNSV
jgi:hypothetical protein